MPSLQVLGSPKRIRGNAEGCLYVKDSKIRFFAVVYILIFLNFLRLYIWWILVSLQLAATSATEVAAEAVHGKRSDDGKRSARNRLGS